MDSIGRYQIRAELGHGGMGIVYRAYDPELDREVALKRVLLEGADRAEREKNEAALTREARAAARLQHPNAVAVYDFFSAGEHAYIVMEFVAGASLQAKLDGGKALPLEGCLQVLRQAASALDAAHGVGIVHRDVKPANLLVDSHGNTKIADFGIARVQGPGTQTTGGMGMSPGTLSYMSPEQVRGEPLDGRSDQFALAVVAYQCLTGRQPFEADNWVGLSYQILNHEPAPPSSVVSSIPASFDAAIARGLAKQAADRFPTCAAFVAALTQQDSSRTPLWAGLAIAAVLAAGAFYFWPTPPAPAIPAPSLPDGRPKIVLKTGPPGPAVVANSITIDGETLEFVPVPAGRFVMGCDTCSEDQRPAHNVEMTQPFEIARTEISERFWNAVLTGKASGERTPIVKISWLDTQRFVGKLNRLASGRRYRLPTEAEWEYAARAGDRELYPRNAGDSAWTSENASGVLQPVGTTKMPNAWGIYDMLGNAQEWVADWVDPNYYAASPARNPQGPASGTARVFRGGDASSSPASASYSTRFGDEPKAIGERLGFRVARDR